MNRSMLRTTGRVLIGLAAMLLLAFPLVYAPIARFMELNFSPDQQFSNHGRWVVGVGYVAGVAALAAAGWLLPKLTDPRWRARAKSIFLREPLSASTSFRPSPRKVLIFAALVGVFLVFCRLVAYKSRTIYLILFWKDRGLFDLFVPLAMIISAVLTGLVIRRMWQGERFNRKTRWLFTALYAGMALAFFVYGMEEISWGQDFFRWETPEAFAGNLESQTNLHNYFNPYFMYGYVALSLVLVVVAASAWLEARQRWLTFKRFALPHPSLIGLALVIAGVALVWYDEQEILEEMVAVFVLIYSLRLWAIYRSPLSATVATD